MLRKAAIIAAIIAGFFAVLVAGRYSNAAAQERSAEPGPEGAAGQDINTLIDLAYRSNGSGRHGEAEGAYRRALEKHLEGAAADDAEVGNILMNLAMEVSNQGRFDEAKAYFDQAAPLVKRSPDPMIESRFVSYLAMDAINRGRLVEARDFARQATALRQSMADSLRKPAPNGLSSSSAGGLFSAMLAEGELAHSLIIEAQASYQLGDLAGAEAAGSRALDIIEKTPRLPAWWKPKVMTILGETATSSGRLERAEPLLKMAAAQARDLFGDSQPTALALFALGRYFAAAGAGPQAREAFLQGLRMMILPQQMDNPLPFDDVAAFFSLCQAEAEGQPANREQILDPMILAMQRVQAGGGSSTVVQFAAADPRIRQAVQELGRVDGMTGELRLQLAAEVARPQEQRDISRQQQLATQFRELSAQGADLRQKLSRDFPGYARLAVPHPVSVSALRSRLGDGEGLVTIVFGSASGQVSLVTQTEVSTAAIDLSADVLDEMVKQLRDGMTIRNGKVAAYDHALAHRLYEKLFGRIEPFLANLHHLHLVVSGSLSGFPLAALEIVAPRADQDRPVWLIDRFALSTWPSAGAFYRLYGEGAVSHAVRPFLGIGAPKLLGSGGNAGAEAPELCRTGQPIPSDILESLPPLPEAAEEIRRVAAQLNAPADDVLIGDAATESNLRKRPLADYQVLYFATHGLLANELRCQPEPALVLSPPGLPATSRDQDGLLEASEIAGLKLDADLVVLSACNTAVNGRRISGESLLSLADIFFLSGARTVLASHWSVPSASTMALMSDLFARHAIHPRDGFAESLRQAQLALINNTLTSHPVHWAGFTLIGGTGPVFEQSKRE